MIFAKLDVCYWRHKKFERAGLEACAYWAGVLAYLREDESSDGLIETDQLGRPLNVGQKVAMKLCERLVEVSLFERHDRGYVLLGYATKNETKEEIAVRRSGTAKRVADLRNRRKGSQSGDLVYFARLPSNGAIKIGTSTNVGDRIAQLRSEFREAVLLVGTMPGGRDVEAGFHEKFSKFRIAGEWFEPNEELERLLSSVSSNIPSIKASYDPSTNGRVPDSDSDSDSDSDLRGRARGGEDELPLDPPATRTRHPNIMADGCMGLACTAWCEGIASVTGIPYGPPSGDELRRLLESFEIYAKDIGARVEWARSAAADYARKYEGRELSTYQFKRWLGSGRPAPFKGKDRDVQKPAAVQTWKADQGK